MTLQLFKSDQIWTQVVDGNAQARAIFHRHYSYRAYKYGRKPKLFVGPGEKLVLLSSCGKALFVWRKFKSLDHQSGVNCSVFRNESVHLSSELILAAEQIAWSRWPAERLYTYVNAGKIKSSNPGYCFKAAGWTVCGITKRHKLIVLEKCFAEKTRHFRTL